MKVQFQIADIYVKNKNIGEKVSEVSSNSRSHFGMKSTEFPRVEIYRILLGVKSTEFHRGEFYIKIPRGEIYRISLGVKSIEFPQVEIYKILKE
jgi:hypothetical protein